MYYLLKLRKILLYDKLYIFIFLLIVLISFIRLNIKKESIYSNKTNTVEGIILKSKIIDNKLQLEIKSKEKLLVNYYIKNNEKINLSLGDKIKVFGTFTIPAKNTDKYLFNYKKYLERNNIYYIVKAYKIEKISSNKNIILSIKQLIINRISNRYLYTFILGDKSYIDKNVLRSYQENSISHLFAISGMHISLLAEIINKLLKKLKIIEENRFKITSIFLIIYLLLVGLSPSILRGVLFYILFTLNKVYYFYIKPINLYLFIVSISLLINPNFIYDVGFQYSYIISISLILKSNYLLSNNYIFSLLKTSIISFIVSIPITLYNFYQINILSIIYNLLYVPLISIIIFPLTLLVFIYKPLTPLYELLIYILENTSLFISKINILKISFIRLPTIVYIIYIVLIMLFIFYNKKIFIYIFLLLLTIHIFIPYINNNSFIEYIDVGQGDSAIIHTNKKTILIDTGGNSNNDNSLFYDVLSPVLKSRIGNNIDYLILTHGDFDHIGEAINLVENFKVKKVIFNCGKFNDLENNIIKLLNKKNIKYYQCIKELNISNNKLYFLQTSLYNNENDNSNVIYIELNNYKFLFMGDAGIEKEKDILNKYNIPNIDVLKVGHHGSKTSSSKIFINEINPKYSIISVGKNNKYGHPEKQVLSNLKYSKIYRTDQKGSIMFNIRNNKLQVETYSP